MLEVNYESPTPQACNANFLEISILKYLKTSELL